MLTGFHPGFVCFPTVLHIQNCQVCSMRRSFFLHGGMWSSPALYLVFHVSLGTTKRSPAVVDQVQQYRYSDCWHHRLCICHYWCLARDGNTQCIPTCPETSLGGVPEQIL